MLKRFGLSLPQEIALTVLCIFGLLGKAVVVEPTRADVFVALLLFIWAVDHLRRALNGEGWW
jgi:hypothetical protein